MSQFYLLLFSFALLLSLSSCNQPQEINIPRYYELVKDAEMQIVNEEYKEAINLYQNAFPLIEKPFGKDVFNAALASQLANLYDERDQYLQIIINNSENAEKTKSVFVGTFLTQEQWDNLLNKKVPAYDSVQRAEFAGIMKKDQLYRPHYDEFDEIIKENEKSNLQQILSFTEQYGFPSQIELGYREDLNGQDHNIVLIHVTRRRAKDKSIMNLKNLMRNAVDAGRMDPEAAVAYIYYQKDDSDSSDYMHLSQYWVYTHDALPDSLKTKIMRDPGIPKEVKAHNELREKWYATTLTERKEKLHFLKKTKLPFIFSSVNRNMNTIDFTFLIPEDELLDKYESMTKGMEIIYTSYSPEMNIKKR